MFRKKIKLPGYPDTMAIQQGKEFPGYDQFELDGEVYSIAPFRESENVANQVARVILTNESVVLNEYFVEDLDYALEMDKVAVYGLFKYKASIGNNPCLMLGFQIHEIGDEFKKHEYGIVNDPKLKQHEPEIIRRLVKATLQDAKKSKNRLDIP